MKTTKSHLLIPLLLVAAAAPLPAADFEIVKVTPELVVTPDYNFSLGPKNKKVPKNKSWLEVEVEFNWQPKDKNAKPLDELTIKYFVLLNDKGDPRTNTLLTGSVTHTAILPGKGLKSVMYLSPRTLERFFAGKEPTTVTAAVYNVGVQIEQPGQPNLSWKKENIPQWWTALSPVPGYLLNKNETPFAPLFYDYYEAIKARPGGM